MRSDAQIFDYQGGDVGYVPRSMPHYVENTGAARLRYLELWQSDHFADVSLAQWFDLVALSGTLRTLAVSLYKIANDIRLMSCGPRAGFAELLITENEPGSSIMPGKVNPTQAEALTMIAVQVMANDVAVGFGGAGGYLEMNVYKPLIIFNINHSITILADGCTNFRKFLIEGTKPNRKKIEEYVQRSLMLVTALSPVIGYDEASKIAHYALDNDLTLKQAALKLEFVAEEEFDRVVDPIKMVHPYLASTN
jgi:fumarate hydratase class II